LLRALYPEKARKLPREKTREKAAELRAPARKKSIWGHLGR